MKRTLFVLLALTMVFGLAMFAGCGGSSSSGGGNNNPPAATIPTYTGTLYMASEGGGHVGVFPVTIDPSNTTTPITITGTATKIQLASGPTSSTKIVFHDVRLDKTADRLYYSAFMSRPTNTAVADIGYLDLTAANTAATNNGINSTIDIDAPAADTIEFALNAMGVGAGLRIEYCASGMNSTTYFPMSMSFPAYIDAIPKTLLNGGGAHVTTAQIKRTYIDQIDADAAGWTRINGSGGADLGTPPLAFIHGASSPDGTKIYMATNVVSGLSTTNNLAGVFRSYMVNASDLEAGTMDTSKVISKATFTVMPSLMSIAYRASFTDDGKYVLQSGCDRLLILNANNLSLYNDTANDTVKIGGGKTDIENHDVMSTPDGKYAILAIRYVDSAGQMKTSGVQLYDIANKKVIGGITTTCGVSSCHAPDIYTARPTCGIVGKLTAH